MTTLETRFMTTVPSILSEISKQLKIANGLKEIELRQHATKDTLDAIDFLYDDMENK